MPFQIYIQDLVESSSLDFLKLIIVRIFHMGGCEIKLSYDFVKAYLSRSSLHQVINGFSPNGDFVDTKYALKTVL